MNYIGMPLAIWVLFSKSFQVQLTKEFAYDAATAKKVTEKAKAKYRHLIRELPAFEQADPFKMNLVSCAMLGAYVLAMPERPNADRLADYYARAMLTPVLRWFCRRRGKNIFTPQAIERMKTASALKAADRNPFSWNLDFYGYPDGSGYEVRFSKCGICTLMQKLGLYDLTPALCRLDYTMSDAGGATDFKRNCTLASGGPYCDCGYKRRIGKG
ncbi:MAG: L-2-amino-thiazoline-4-carboxylic acid hydrolase [Oscillospiraceae bacterium]|nr:L-2-amino-thiazoline-4-carboxylic acid hydrolase [Oscillospiraceae bacterium]